MDEDLGRLKILSIFHYIVAAMAGLFACFPIIHLLIGITILTGGFFEGGTDQGFPFPASLFGLIFTVIPATIILFGWAFAICLAVAGYYLSKRLRYSFCLIMAGISCTFSPFGTVLGVFTIVVLMSPSVKELFKNQIQTAVG
jgi:hypothetical protein